MSGACLGHLISYLSGWKLVFTKFHILFRGKVVSDDPMKIIPFFGPVCGDEVADMVLKNPKFTVYLKIFQ